MNKLFPYFLLALLCLLAAFSVAPWEETLCRSGVVKEILELKNKDGAVNCFDFWINRYQTLITGIFAGLALIAALQQLREARRQAKAAIDQTNIARVQGEIAIRQGAFASFEFWSKRLVKLRHFKEVGSRFRQSAGNIRADLSMPSSAKNCNIEDADKIYNEMTSINNDFIWFQGSDIIQRHINNCKEFLIFAHDTKRTWDFYAQIGKKPPGERAMGYIMREIIYVDDASQVIEAEIRSIEDHLNRINFT